MCPEWSVTYVSGRTLVLARARRRPGSGIPASEGGERRARNCERCCGSAAAPPQSRSTGRNADASFERCRRHFGSACDRWCPFGTQSGWRTEKSGRRCETCSPFSEIDCRARLVWVQGQGLGRSPSTHRFTRCGSSALGGSKEHRFAQGCFDGRRYVVETLYFGDRATRLHVSKAHFRERLPHFLEDSQW